MYCIRKKSNGLKFQLVNAQIVYRMSLHPILDAVSVTELKIGLFAFWGRIADLAQNWNSAPVVQNMVDDLMGDDDEA